MAVKVHSKIQQINDLTNNNPSFYILDAKDIQFNTEANGRYINGTPGDGNDLESIIRKIQNDISIIPRFEIIPCSSLPTENINPAGLYLVTTNDDNTNNICSEYVYKDGEWELVGIQKSEIADMASVTWVTNNYKNNTQLTTTLSNYAHKTNNNSFSGVNKFTGKTELADTVLRGNLLDPSDTSIGIISKPVYSEVQYLRFGNTANKVMIRGNGDHPVYMNSNDNSIKNIALSNDLPTTDVAYSGSYTDLLNIPSEFNPCQHNHKYSEISDLSLNNTLTKIVANNVTTLGVNLGYTTNNRNYKISASSTGALYTNVPWTDTIYTHPSYTQASSGFYKVTVDSTGHVSSVTSVVKKDITDLGIPAQDTKYSAGTGLSLSSTTFNLQAPTSTTIGGVKAGTNTSIDSNGTISVSFKGLATETYVTTRGYATTTYVDNTKNGLVNNATTYTTLKAIEDKLNAIDDAISKLTARVTNIETKITNYIDGTDTSLDQISEIVTYIKNNREDLDALGKVKSALVVGNTADTADIAKISPGGIVFISDDSSVGTHNE